MSVSRKTEKHLLLLTCVIVALVGICLIVFSFIVEKVTPEMRTVGIIFSSIGIILFIFLRYFKYIIKSEISKSAEKLGIRRILPGRVEFDRIRLDLYDSSKDVFWLAKGGPDLAVPYNVVEEILNRLEKGINFRLLTWANDHKIDSKIGRLMEIVRRSKGLGRGKIEVRIYEKEPSWYVQMIDDTIFVQPYLHGVGMYDVPMFELESGKELHEYFFRHSEIIWRDAKPIGQFLKDIIMNKEQSIQKLTRQLGFVDKLKTTSSDSQEFIKWHRDTRVAVQIIFGKDAEHLEEFDSINYSYPKVSATDDKHQEAYLEGLEDVSALLKSFIDEINEYWSDVDPESVREVIDQEQLGKDIFIVHGHDEAAKQMVARFIEKLDLNPIVLHEKPNVGRTVIEKFEYYTNVGFAVVLMTPDDVGASVDDKDKLKLRSRQNVVFELGFFLGILGRKRVCALYKEGVEIPSDYQGVLFVPMDKDWKLLLAREINAAGIPIDLNKAIE